jgi:hypothetical protein
MTVVLAMSADGVHFATGSGTLSWLPERTFQALRARNGGPPPTVATITSEPAAPVATPYRAASDSLLAAGDPLPDRCRLLIPLSHPVYFDHPLDHVPGMLLLDAAWQAAVTLHPSGPIRLVECWMTCPAFTELFGEAWVFLHPVATDRIDFRIEQETRTTATGTMRYASIAGRGSETN